MATVNYSWTLPTVGASVNTWGTLLNTIIDDIDAKMVSKTDAQTLTNKTLAAPVITGGASISGNVSVTGALSATNGFTDYGGDTATVFQSLNTSAGNAQDFSVQHDSGNVKLGSPRGALKLMSLNTVQATLDTSGNLGLGVTPSAWVTGAKALQVANYAALAQRGGTADLSLSWNATIASGTNSGTGYVYRNTGDLASAYEMNGAHRWYVAPSGTAGNAITFTQAMTLDTSGLAVVGSVSATGINFPTTQNPSPDPNTLDDYEEGTWTPTFGYNSTDPTVTGYSAQVGWYVKVGRLVTVYCDVEASSISGGSGTGIIRGLPFTSSNIGIGRNHPVGTFRDCNAVASGGSNTTLVGFVDNNSNYMYLQFNQINGAYGTTGTVTWNGSGRVTFSVTYYAAN